MWTASEVSRGSRNQAIRLGINKDFGLSIVFDVVAGHIDCF